MGLQIHLAIKKYGNEVRKYKTEFVVWGRIPSAAIVSVWMWDDVVRNSIDPAREDR